MFYLISLLNRILLPCGHCVYILHHDDQEVDSGNYMCVTEIEKTTEPFFMSSWCLHSQQSPIASGT